VRLVEEDAEGGQCCGLEALERSGEDFARGRQDLGKGATYRCLLEGAEEVCPKDHRWKSSAGPMTGARVLACL